MQINKFYFITHFCYLPVAGEDFLKGIRRGNCDIDPGSKMDSYNFSIFCHQLRRKSRTFRRLKTATSKICVFVLVQMTSICNIF